MAQQSFSAAVDAWVLESKARLDVVFKNSAEAVSEDVIDRMSEKTPNVITGFARASFTASLDGPLPARADAVPPKDAAPNSYPRPTEYALVINGAALGDTIYASFVAAYARRLEYGFNGTDSLGRTYHQPGFGMVRLAAQNWPQHVAKAVREAKAAVASRSKQ